MATWSQLTASSPTWSERTNPHFLLKEDGGLLLGDNGPLILDRSLSIDWNVHNATSPSWTVYEAPDTEWHN